MVAYKNLYTRLLIYLYYYKTSLMIFLNDIQFNSINSFINSVEPLVYRDSELLYRKTILPCCDLLGHNFIIVLSESLRKLTVVFFWCRTKINGQPRTPTRLLRSVLLLLPYFRVILGITLSFKMAASSSYHVQYRPDPT